jgi:hypothetical protein
MGEFKVAQRTKDGMFNATALLKQWNEKSISERKMANYFLSEKTNDFISTIIERENLNTPKMVYLTSRGKHNGGTWMHPMLFIDFAMWINPSFKYEVIKFVYDQMIKYRNEAGDAYKELSAAIYTIVDKSQMPSRMAEVSKGINYVVFGEHRNMIRNDKGTEQDQRKLYEMERKVASLINDGFLKDHGQVMNYLRKKFQERTTPAVFVR